jgi:hypothetical protein
MCYNNMVASEMLPLLEVPQMNDFPPIYQIFSRPTKEFVVRIADSHWHGLGAVRMEERQGFRCFRIHKVGFPVIHD